MKKILLFLLLSALSFSQIMLVAQDQVASEQDTVIVNDQEQVKTNPIKIRTCAIKGTTGIFATLAGAFLTVCSGYMGIEGLWIKYKERKSDSKIRIPGSAIGLEFGVAGLGIGLMAYGIRNMKCVCVDTYSAIKSKRANIEEAQTETSVEAETTA